MSKSDWAIDGGDDDLDELEDSPYIESPRDTIIFCINCSESMLLVRPNGGTQSDDQRSNLHMALQCAVDVQKRKVLYGPQDSVGILLYNTADRNTDVEKENTFLFQPVSQINAANIKALLHLLNDAKADPNFLRERFKPLQDSKVPLGNVFQTCNMALRSGAPKTSVRRVFLITDDDDPVGSDLRLPAKTSIEDLYNLGAMVTPFFINPPDREFDPAKFYSDVLAPPGRSDEPELFRSGISSFQELLAEMRIREMPKRSFFHVPLRLGDGFSIDVKGYGLVVQQKKGAHRFFADQGRVMQDTVIKTVYFDEEQQTEVDKSCIVYGLQLGASGAQENIEEEGSMPSSKARGMVRNRVLFTPEQVKEFRTMGLEPGIRLLGFKNGSELAFEDNVKHSYFVYPSEDLYEGSVRTFSALLRAMVKKEQTAIALAVMRKNSPPVFCALVPQAEKLDEGGWQIEPPGLHLVPLPFADDIRPPKITQAAQGSQEQVKAALALIHKLTGKKGYQPDAYPNPALALHYGWLEATAFDEEYDPESSFEDHTRPPYDRIHLRAGALMKEWKDLVDADPNAHIMSAEATRRPAVTSVDDSDVRARYAAGTLNTFTVAHLKAFLSQHSQPLSGTKAILIERVGEWHDRHP